MKLKNKTALVTGASSGIGEACARALSGNGAKVILTGRNQKKLEQLSKEIGGIFLTANLSISEDVVSLFEAIDGSIDILVNNAGVAPKASIIDGDVEAFQTLLNVNVLALTHCCQLALKKFDPKNGGQIVNISSMSGHRVPPSGGFYAATKFAVRAVTEALRYELKSKGNKTRVTMISPGFVDTPLLENYFRGDEETLSALRQDIEMLKPQDIAQTLIHILETPKHVEIGDVMMRPSDQKI
ncbi:MAG: short-chain dehydrogenase [Verrucomicrobiales bacterium]|jgi:NADP-dependent 3-hydroxy acid dehydrogenase YdfG|nr:short-chain dehydrogenase [Verrucomicrobiales bacterium]